MKKLKLPYPLDDNGKPKGTVYKLWTKELPLKPQVQKISSAKSINIKKAKKPWWKFW